MGNHWPLGWSQKWPKSPLGDSSNLDLGSLFKNPYVVKWLHFELLLLSFGAKLSHMVMVFVKPHTYLTYAKAFGWIWFQPWFSPNTVFGHFFQKRSVKNMQHPFKIEEVHTNLVANTCHVWLWGRLAHIGAEMPIFSTNCRVFLHFPNINFKRFYFSVAVVWLCKQKQESSYHLFLS